MGATLLAQVDDLRDVITTDVEAMERDRRLSDDVVAAIRASGLNRVALPTELGGSDAHLLEVLEAIERIAAIDGSTGWCAAIGSLTNVFAGYMPHDGAVTVFTDPDQGNAGVFGPCGDVRRNGEGLTLTGRWPFCSNSLHSAWVGLGSWWYGDGDQPEPIPRLVFVPAADLAIEPTWDAPGLCGTGSHHASVEAAAVERDRSLTFADQPWPEGPLWRLPLFGVLGPALGFTLLGMARGAVDEVRQRIADGVVATRGSLVDDPVSLADFAEADAALRGARAGVIDACGRAWDIAERGQRPPKTLQAEVLMSVNYGCQVAVEVTSTAHRLGGGSAAYAGSSLLRRLRDVETARQHIMFGQGSRPVFAKALAGEDTFAPPFFF